MTKTTKEVHHVEHRHRHPAHHRERAQPDARDRPWCGGSDYGTALSAALGAFQGLPTAIVIAVIAAMCVALVITGFVLTWDMRVRGQQTRSDNYLKYQRKHDKDCPQPAQNGDAADKLPGVPIVPSAAGQTVLHFGPFRLGLREEDMSAVRGTTPASG